MLTEEADEEPKDTVIDKYGTHLVQGAKSYTEGFTNRADKIEALWVW